MADIRLPFASLLNPQSGIKLVNEYGQDITHELLGKVQQSCPELLNSFIESALFKLPENTSAPENTPQGMAQRFGVEYLGKLPMDPNMMRACEEGRSFLQAYSQSAAARPFEAIVNRIIAKTPDQLSV